MTGRTFNETSTVACGWEYAAEKGGGDGWRLTAPGVCGRPVPSPLIVNFGGGVNSTALLVGYHERGIRPDAILFADTGDEKPETYEHLLAAQSWLERVRFPSLQVIRRVITRGRNFGGHVDTLEKECYANRTLPSRVFGRKGGCSGKWKRQPVDGYVKRRWRQHIKAGGRIRRALGIDFGEFHRAKFQPTGAFDWEYPLIDWRWARAECVEAIERAGLRVPTKSACFYCPATTKLQMVALMQSHPELHERALKMEAMGLPSLKKKVGLGGNWNWQEETNKARRGLPIVDAPGLQMPCGSTCYDGG